MNNTQISFLQLKNEVNELYYLLIQLDKIPKKISSQISPAFIPCLAFICEEGDKFIGGDVYKNIYGSKFKGFLRQIRLYNKLNYDKRIGLTKRAIKRLLDKSYNDLVYDYNIFQRLYVQIFGQDNYMIALYKNKPYFNYLQLYELLDYMEYDDIVISFSASMSEYISKLKSVFDIYNSNKSNKEFKRIDNLDDKDFQLKDYKLYKNNNIFNGNCPLEISAYLFNLLCSINFLIEVFPLLISTKSSLYNRYKMVIYISVANAFGRLKEQKIFKDTGWYEYFLDFSATKDKIITSDVRNNIFHYNIFSKEKITIEDVKFQNIISQIINRPFDEVSDIIDIALSQAVEKIETIIF